MRCIRATINYYYNYDDDDDGDDDDDDDAEAYSFSPETASTWKRWSLALVCRKYVTCPLRPVSASVAVTVTMLFVHCPV